MRSMSLLRRVARSSALRLSVVAPPRARALRRCTSAAGNSAAARVGAPISSWAHSRAVRTFSTATPTPTGTKSEATAPNAASPPTAAAPAAAATDAPASPYNIAELFARNKPADRDSANSTVGSDSSSGSGRSGGASGSSGSGGDGNRFFRAGLPLLVLVVGGSVALSYVTVHRYEQSNRFRSGTDAAAKGASRDLPVSTFSTARAAAAKRAAGGADAAAAEESAPASESAPPSGAPKFDPTPLPGGGRADGTEAPRFTYRSEAAPPPGAPAGPAVGSDEELLRELERTRRELKWSESYEIKRVQRPKGQEDQYLYGHDPERVKKAETAATAATAAAAKRS